MAITCVQLGIGLATASAVGAIIYKCFNRNKGAEQGQNPVQQEMNGIRMASTLPSDCFVKSI